MVYRPHFLYRLKIIFVYLLVKVKFLQALLPKQMRDNLPIGWNEQMFWVAFTSGGTRLYYDYYSKLREPASYKPQAEVSAEHRLSEEDVQSFYRNGYIGPFTLMQPEEAVGLREHLVDLATNKETTIHSFGRGDYKFESEDGALSEGEEYAINRFTTTNRHLEDAILRDLFKSPAITDRCAQLLGPDLLLWRSQFFPAEPQSNGTPWHQTSTWMIFDWRESILHPSDVSELFQVTCWIALTDVPKERAALKFVRGSQWELYPTKFEPTESDVEKIYGRYSGYLDYDVDPADVDTIEMKAGQFIIFSERAAHGSEDNVTDEWRWAVNGRIVKTDVRVFTEKMLKDGVRIEGFGIESVPLDKWDALLIRGEDKHGYNRLFQEERVVD